MTSTTPKAYYTCLKCHKIVDASSPSSEYCKYSISTKPNEVGCGYCNDCAKTNVYECEDKECFCDCRTFICGSCKKKSKTTSGSEYCENTDRGYCKNCANDNNFFCESSQCKCGYVKSEYLDCCYSEKFNCKKCNNLECPRFAHDSDHKLCNRCYDKSVKSSSSSKLSSFKSEGY